MLKIENVSFRYPDGSMALKDCSFELPRTHILAILGESGSGKTTLLNCIGRFLRPKSGTITLNGRDIGDIGEVEFRRSIGIVFQKLHLFPHLTVLENLILAPTKVLKMDIEEARQEAMSTLERLNIGELSERYPAQISGGQAQRAAIARALVLKPMYLMLDEPTSALDINTTSEFGRWLVNLKEETTFVIVTHDVPFVRGVATRGVLLENGTLSAAGDIETILNDLEEQQK